MKSECVRSQRTRAATATILPLVGLGVFGSNGTAQAAAPVCDAKFKVDPNDSLRYQARGDRCEGRYEEPVAQRVEMRLAGLLRGGNAPDPRSIQALTLQWRSDSRQAVHISATSLRNHFFYRMDLSRDRFSARYEWSTDVLRSLDVRGPELGVLAWLEDGRNMATYLPVAFETTNDLDPDSKGVTAQIVSLTRLKRVFVTIEKEVTGKSVSGQGNRRELGLGFYPAETPIPVRLLRRYEGGTYDVEIIAEQMVGAPLHLGFKMFLE